MERTCKKCGETKLVEEFPKDRNRYRLICRKCYNEENRNKHKLNPEKKRERDNRYKSKNVEKLREYFKEYRSKNAEKLRERRREYRGSDKYREYRIKNADIILLKRKEKVKEKAIKARIYRLQNPEKIRAQELKRRYKRRDEIHIANLETVKNLPDRYVINCIRNRIKISPATLRNYPELIEEWRQQIKVKRLLKSKKDENTETS